MTGLKKSLELLEHKTHDIVSLTQELIKFNTTAPNPGEESACQTYIAHKLKSSGFDVDVWEPDVEDLRKAWFLIPGQDFKGRPIVVGRLKGEGSGKSIILNSHIDVVPAHPLGSWKHHPFGAIMEDGRIYGRGAADMKGGLAASLSAVEALTRSGVKLKGDVIFESVTDEEVGSQGTAACVRRGYKADGAVVLEPTSLNIDIANRGLLWGKLSVLGRAAHAELAGELPEWNQGGPVNAIEKALAVLTALSELSNEWSHRADKKHSLLSTPKIVPTFIKGGNYAATYPDTCEITLNTQYLPTNRDSKGFGSNVRQEIEQRVECVAKTDPWMRVNPPSVEWTLDIPPVEIDPGHPIVRTLVQSAQSVGVQTKLQGMNTSDDAVPLIRLASVPTITFGPGDLKVAHTVDEWVSIRDIVTAAKTVTAFLVNWCELA